MVDSVLPGVHLISGFMVPLDSVPDPGFAGDLLGDGIAIDPFLSELLAPTAGTSCTSQAMNKISSLCWMPGNRTRPGRPHRPICTIRACHQTHIPAKGET